MTPESMIRNSICSWLRFNKALVFIHDSVGIFDPIKRIYRSNKSPYRMKGVADLLGIWKGKPLAIEVKVKGSYPSPEQKAFLEMWRQHGGIGFVARSIEDVVRELGGQNETTG